MAVTPVTRSDLAAAPAAGFELSARSSANTDEKAKHAARYLTMPWLTISSDGACEQTAHSAGELARRCSLPPRDLLLLLKDGQAGTVLVRDAAFLINLERTRVLVTADEALLPGAEDAAAQALAASLAAALASTTPRSVAGEQLQWLRIDAHGGRSLLVADRASVARRCRLSQLDVSVLLGDAPSVALSDVAALNAALHGRRVATVVALEHARCLVMPGEVLLPPCGSSEALALAEALSSRLTSAAESAGVETLPFELTVLDVALESVAASLETLTRQLEADSDERLRNYNPLVSSASSQRMRQLKSSVSAAARRTWAVREQLLLTLDDDDRMRQLSLSTHAGSEAQSRGDGGFSSPGPSRVTQSFRRAGLSFREAFSPGESVDAEAGEEAVPDTLLARAAARLAEDDSDVQEVEDVLEHYFAALDRTHMRLAALEQEVEHYEEYTLLALDAQRNLNIEMLLVLKMLNYIVNLYTAIGSVFQENLIDNTGLTHRGPAAVKPFHDISIACPLIVAFLSGLFLWVGHSGGWLHLFAKRIKPRAGLARPAARMAKPPLPRGASARTLGLAFPCAWEAALPPSPPLAAAALPPSVDAMPAASFECTVLQVALHSVFHKLDAAASALATEMRAAIGGMASSRVLPAALQRLKAALADVSVLAERAGVVRSEMLRLLSDDSDLYDMRLSRKKALLLATPAPREREGLNEQELVIESYFSRFDSMHRQLDALSDEAKKALELVNVDLSVVRNRMLQIQMVVYNGMVWHGVASALVTILGVNFLLNYSSDQSSDVQSQLWSNHGMPAFAFKIGASMSTGVPFLLWMVTNYLLKRMGFLAS